MERRQLLKWVAPAILTYPVLPSFARAGSEVPGEESWSIDYSVRGDIAEAQQFYGTGSLLFLKGAQTTVYIQRNGTWEFLGIYGFITLPEGVPMIAFTGAYDQAVVHQ